MTGTARIIRGNALALPLADASVDLICTSPPFFALRSYQDAGEHYAGQIGSEPTPAEFVDALIAATREMVRVLKPSGSIWVNLGDKYAGSGPGGPQNGKSGKNGGETAKNARRGRQGLMPVTNVPTKSLIGIPWRYALRCIDELGLILRAEIIWAKPNGLPESVTDRVRRSHEQWFHLVKQPRYFSAVDEIREQAEARKGAMSWAERRAAGEPTRRGEQGANDATVNGMLPNPLGKLPCSVWTIPTQPLTVPPELGVDHFAAFPMEWPRRIIQGWSPREVCSVCGEGRRPKTQKDRDFDHVSTQAKQGKGSLHNNERGTLGVYGLGKRDIYRDVVTITGYACACPDTTAPTTPGTILDPFGGTGTTALMAKALGRTGISVDMSADYSRLATWRTTDPGQLAAALQVEKPEPISPDQLDLFGESVA
jgi:DNA modification methylase